MQPGKALKGCPYSPLFHSGSRCCAPSSLRFRAVWCYLLPLGIGSWSPNWTQMFNEKQVGLPLQRDFVRLSLYSRPPHPILWASPPFPCGSGNQGRTCLQVDFLHMGQTSEPLANLPQWCQGQVTRRRDLPLIFSHMSLPLPQRLLLAQQYLLGICEWSRLVWFTRMWHSSRCWWPLPHAWRSCCVGCKW